MALARSLILLVALAAVVALGPARTGENAALPGARAGAAHRVRAISERFGVAEVRPAFAWLAGPGADPPAARATARAPDAPPAPGAAPAPAPAAPRPPPRSA
jgi:hypothetical protein